MLKKLDEILLSDNVVDNFKNELNNKEFNKYIKSNLPEIFECLNFKQNTPWHIYDVLDHILHSIEEINKQTKYMKYKERKLLAYVMLFHDLRKPRSRTIEIKDGKEIDRFIGHNTTSAEIAKERLDNFGFNDKEKRIIIKLIEEHDMFIPLRTKPTNNPYLTFLTDDVIIKKIIELNSVGNGRKLMNYLIKIGKADNRSQNPEMANRSFGVLNKCDAILKNINYNIYNPIIATPPEF